MINLRNLKHIRERSSDGNLQFVVDYILNKIQRDKSEFSRYRYEEDWVELDQYLGTIERKKDNADFLSLRELINDNKEDDYSSNDTSFERTLLRHLSNA